MTALKCITLRFSQSLSGNNYAHQRNDEVDYYDIDEALSLIHAGIAKPICDEGKKFYREYREKQLAKEAAKRQAAKVSGPAASAGQKKEPEANSEPAVRVPIAELDLDEATLKVLAEAGLETVADVANHPDLTKINGVAKATAAKILKAIKQ